MPISQVIKCTDSAPVKIWTDDIDQKSIQQLTNVASLPFIHKHVAAMPDVHLGYGVTIGAVIPTRGAIIPSAVGVDIGCGMNAVRLSLTADELPDNLHTVRTNIEKAIPLGAGGAHQKPQIDMRGRIAVGLATIVAKHPLIGGKQANGRYARQLGTLGSGNHFIEICLDESNQVWIMLHSGSRGIGNIIGTYFINLAKKDMERMFISLPDKDLAYFVKESEIFIDYWQAVKWAQNYALYNRHLMIASVISTLHQSGLPEFTITTEAINCHHNYVDLETHYGANVYVTRKGAIGARKGQLGIIPGSMGDKSYIVEGTGNKESFCSCSHGAGRRMSRTVAKATFTVADLEAQTKGIECSKDADKIDEIPSAYKPIDEVMANQSDLVKVLHTLHQVVNVKG